MCLKNKIYFLKARTLFLNKCMKKTIIKMFPYITIMNLYLSIYYYLEPTFGLQISKILSFLTNKL